MGSKPVLKIAPRIAAAQAEQRYPIVLCDPPWSYRDAGGRGSALRHYDTLRPLDIALQVDRNASRNAVLFLWCTWPTIDDAFAVASMAGFRYKTCAFVWVKTTATGKIHWGMGHWTRANTEPCLLFVRGTKHPRPIAHNIHEVVVAPVSRHSAKPAEVRERIVGMFGDRPRIELYARERSAGWAAHGDEVPEDVST